MSPERTYLHGRPVDYVLKRSRRRTIGFAISHDGLTVTAPQRLARREIEAALDSKADWILNKLDSWAARPKLRELVLETGAMLPWRGTEVPLILEGSGIRTRVSQDAAGILIRHDPALDGELRERTLKAALVRHYKRAGEAYMAPRIRAYAETLDRTVRRVIVRDQKRRWGSCAPDGTIRMNWRLMGFPDHLTDYVCAHEAAHLVEANHSPAYWRVVESLMPDWKTRRDEIRAQSEQWVAF